MLYKPKYWSITMTNIDPKHAKEFADSAISPDIAAMNFRSFDGTDENELDDIFTQLIESPDHNNNGMLSGKSQNDLANAIRGGGWGFKGYRGICIKPDNPRSNADGKNIKYESPRGQGNLQVSIPNVSVGAGKEIATKHGLEQEYSAHLEYLFLGSDLEAEDTGFWEWFLETNIPIVITEGCKKACSLVSNGYPSIGLNGIWGSGTNDKDMFGNHEKDADGNSVKSLHPDLDPFLYNREIILAFDRDNKEKTRRMVEAAKASLVRMLDDPDLKVTDLKWRTNHKGVDDYIAAQGVKSLDRLYANRKEIKPKQPKEKVKQTQFITSIEHGLQRVTSSESEGGKETNSTEQIGNHLEAIAYLDNPEGTNAAILLELKTVRNQIRKLSIPRSDLAGDGVEILSHLMGSGYGYNRKNKTELLEYLHGLGAGIEQTYTIVDSTGWIDGRYVSQHKTYGDGDYVFQQVELSSDAATEIKGTLKDWKDNVGAKCDNNSRLIFIIGIAFAAPLLAIVGLESGGFHLMGDTSTGKTTAVKVAVSVTGEKEIPNWRTTANGLEMTATSHNHSMLPLDEIGQADEKGVGEACYMLRNGQGKSRSTKDLKVRKVKTWQLLFLSTGEHSLASYMALAGKVQKGGQEVGMPDIPAVPFGSPYGVFESIHGCESSKEFAENLEAACQKYRGTAIEAFLTQLVIDRQDKGFDGATSERVFKAAKKLSEETIDLAVSRVANRFALVQIALEIAHSYDILPFPIDRIEWAVKKMFADWLTQRGGDGSIEIKNAVKRIKHLLVSNEFSDRVFTLPDNSDRSVRGLLAYRKLDLDGQTEEFWIPTTTFDKEFCDGANKKELVKELQRLGWLLPPRPDGKSTHQRSRKGETNYYFVFGKRVLLGEGGEGSEGKSLNADADELLEPSPSLHHSKNTSEGSEGSPTKNDVSLHRLHQPSLTGEGSIKAENDYPASTLDLPSLPSLPSPLKIQVGEISKLKVKESEVIDCEDF
jgi:putative DNA primase/helicase